MTLGSLFDGIGGFLMAATHNGIEPIWASEIEKFPVAVTARRFPQVQQLGDVNSIDGAKIAPVDIVCAGSPCQDLSIAGKQEGLNGARSSLFYRAVDIVRQMQRATGGKYPRFFVWENVPGAFSSNKGADFRAVLAEIGAAEIPIPANGRWATAGLVELPECEIAWRVLDAQFFGVPQRRKRIFLVADFGEAGRCAGKILFERQSVPGDTPKGRTQGKGTAAGTGGGAHDTGRCAVLRMRAGKPGGGKGALVSYDKSLTLAANTNDQTLFCLNDQGGESMTVENDTVGTLRAEAHGHIPLVFDMTHADEVLRRVDSNKSNTLNARMGTGGNQTPLVFSIAGNTIGREDKNGGNGKGVQEGISYTLNTTDLHAIANDKVRRYTPRECERLQGLPDDYTLIDDKSCSDSARYKALGNGMAQPCADWVIRRIVEVVST